MNKALTLAAAILFAALPLTAAAQATAPAEQNDPQRAPRSGSLKQDIKNDAKTAKQEIKSDARAAKQSVKSTAKKTKRALAVAVCNDGRYSYKTYNTCSNHGGVKRRLR